VPGRRSGRIAALDRLNALRQAPLGTLDQLVAHAAALERRAARLVVLAERLALLDPRQVLSRGYALIESEAGRVVVAPSQLRAGERLTVSLAQGQAEIVPREVRQREG